MIAGLLSLSLSLTRASVSKTLAARLLNSHFFDLHHLAFQIWSFFIFRFIFYTKLPPDSDISNAFRCFSNSAPFFVFSSFQSTLFEVVEQLYDNEVLGMIVHRCHSLIAIHFASSFNVSTSFNSYNFFAFQSIWSLPYCDIDQNLGNLHF